MQTRMIGIDFGTSTTVLKVKNYIDGKPIGGNNEVKSVVFENGSSMVPTLIRIDDNEKRWFGHEAAIAKRHSSLFRAFKVHLEDEDPAVRKQARELTASFFKYLFDVYSFQKKSGLFGSVDAEEATMISFPVKWNEETRAFMIQTAADAGFPNVNGMDEAEAAIRSILVMCGSQIFKSVPQGEPATILLVDMGAGTTDLVLCRCTLDRGIRNEILSVWPREGGAFFGGSEVDQLLSEYAAKLLPADGGEEIVRRIRSKDQFKLWKESYVSPSLAENKTVEEFYELDSLCDILGVESPDVRLDREQFYTILAQYLPQLSALILDCLRDGNVYPQDVDLVVLTGGHSNWYFVRDILQGKLPQFGAIGLRKVEADPSRIIRTALPQETVSIGLVMEDSLLAGAAATAVRPTPIQQNEPQQQTVPQPYPVQGTYPVRPQPMPEQPAPVPSGGKRYMLTGGKTPMGIANSLQTDLQCKGMDAQIVQNGNIIYVQARDAKGTIKQFVGMDKATTVELRVLQDGRVVDATVGKGKWIDKGVAAAVSWFVFWPFAVTAIVGVIQQVALKEQVFKAIDKYMNT